MDIWYNLRIHDAEAGHLPPNLNGESLQSCMDACVKNKHCNSISYDKRTTHKPTVCQLFKSHQFGQFYKSKQEDGDKKHPEYYKDDNWDTAMLCSFEAHNKPTRQPDAKYTLKGKFK